MLRALKITLVLFGAVVGIEGLLDLALPVRRAEGMGLGQGAAHAQLPMAVLGATWLVVGAWTIAAARDPLRHIQWLKLAVTFPLALLVALLSLVVRGQVSFQAVAVDLAFDALFVVLFLVFFPRSSAEATTHDTNPS